MQAEVLLDTSERSKELRYVTLHFQSLQGLRSAPCWLSFLFLAGIAESRVLSSRTMAWVGFGIATLNFGGYFAIGNWYSRRFGIVKKPEAAVPSGLISIMNPEVRTRAVSYNQSQTVIFMFYVLDMTPQLFRRVDHQSGLFCLFAITFAVLPRLMYSSSSLGLVRLRRVASIAAAATIGLTYLSYRCGPAGRWQLLEVLFATLLLLDLYDHWLLTRLLSGPTSGASHA
jgi:hypothetical protein